MTAYRAPMLLTSALAPAHSDAISTEKLAAVCVHRTGAPESRLRDSEVRLDRSLRHGHTDNLSGFPGNSTTTLPALCPWST